MHGYGEMIEKQEEGELQSQSENLSPQDSKINFGMYENLV